jgi:hypothetical protein
VQSIGHEGTKLQQWCGVPVTDGSSGGASDTPGASEVDAAWLVLAEELVLAVNHALANRMAALMSLVRVLEYGDSASQPLLPVLQQEVERLERTTALLRILPREPAAPPEPVRLVDVVPDAIGLHALRSDARDLDIRADLQPDLPPVWGEPVAISHAVLAMLDAVTRHRSADQPVDVSAAVEDDAVEFLVEGGSVDHGRFNTAVVAELVRRAGGLLKPDEERRRVGALIARFPTLESVRRREGGAG